MGRTLLALNAAAGGGFAAAAVLMYTPVGWDHLALCAIAGAGGLLVGFAWGASPTRRLRDRLDAEQAKVAAAWRAGASALARAKRSWAC